VIRFFGEKYEKNIVTQYIEGLANAIIKEAKAQGINLQDCKLI